MAFSFSYTTYQAAPDPVRPVQEEEFRAMKGNLNHFMHIMLKALYADPQTPQGSRPFSSTRLLGFAGATALAVAGMVFLEKPLAVGLCGFLVVILGMATLAVPITHFQDQILLKKGRRRFIQEIKSYYLFQYSILRQAEDYTEYQQLAAETSPEGIQPYLDKYLD